MEYKIRIDDQMYKTWSVLERDSLCEVSIPDFHPAKQKLFDKDIFTYDDATKKVSIQSSDIRSGNSLAGILVLERNKTYGRTKNKKRLLYKCIPNNKHLPGFLIPYTPAIGFSKMQKNKYVTFKFDYWEDQHPHGGLIHVIGDVDKLENFYEYQLYCKNLHISFSSFIDDTRKKMNILTEEEHIQSILENRTFEIEDRRHISNIFSIDPKNSVDIDDAFSIILNKDNTYSFTIYIANVFLWLEVLDLWKSFCDRVSTIYLPDRKQNMLPQILSNNVCSLLENKSRFAFAMNMTILPNGTIQNISYHNVLISVFKNYGYEEEDLFCNSDYNQLLEITQKMDRSIVDSHDVVRYWMIKMNSICGEYMASRKIGIFRHSTQKEDNVLEDISHLELSSQRIIRMCKSEKCKYELYESEKGDKERYIQITSPIRRIVDILNQIWLIGEMGINISKEAKEFINEWKKRIEYINERMKSVRKIERECEILEKCNRKPEILSNLHEGIIIEKYKRSEERYEYMVYLENIKLLCPMKTELEFEKYTIMNYKVYLFEDEESLKKKVRIQYEIDSK